MFQLYVDKHIPARQATNIAHQSIVVNIPSKLTDRSANIVIYYERFNIENHGVVGQKVNNEHDQLICVNRSYDRVHDDVRKHGLASNGAKIDVAEAIDAN